MIITLYHYLSLSVILFIIGVLGVFINRKNLILILVCFELILLSVNINLVAFSVFLHILEGQIFTIFILTVAAAESAIGLAIILLNYKLKKTINIDDLNTLKG